MAVTVTPYSKATHHLLTGRLNAEGPLKAALVTGSYVPDFDAHDFFADVTGELVGVNYPAGGFVLANKVVTHDPVNDRSVVTADNTDALGLPQAAEAAVLYQDTGDPLTAPLIAYIDFDRPLTDLTLRWNLDGLIRLRIAQPV